MLIEKIAENGVPAVKENKDTSEAQGIIRQNTRCETGIEAHSQVCRAYLSESQYLQNDFSLRHHNNLKVL